MWSAIFYLEFLRTGRRFRLHLVRWLFAGWLLLLLFIATTSWRSLLFFPFTMLVPQGPSLPPADALLLQQLLLIVLTVPAFASGAITEEKSLATLPELLTSSLTPWQIIVGKLLSRAAQVAFVALTALPLLCFFGGLPPSSVVAAGLVGLGIILPLAALGVLASVLCRTSAAAVMLTYVTAGAAIAVVEWLGGPLRYLDPLYVLEPTLTLHGLDQVGARLVGSLVLWSLLALGMLALAAWRLRPAYTRQFLESRPTTATAVRGRRKPVGDDAVRWKERYMGGLGTLPLLRRLPRWIGPAGVAAASVFVSLAILAAHLPPSVTPASLAVAVFHGDFAAVASAIDGMASPALSFAGLGLVVVLLAGLAVNVRAAGTVSGEREKGTWDMLLLAGLGPRAMLRSKLLGIIEATYPYLIAYAAPAALLGALGGALPTLAVLGCLAITWPSMYLSGAMALERSSRYPSAWKSMLDSLPLTAILVGMLGYGPVVFTMVIVLMIGVIGRGAGLGVLGTLAVTIVFAIGASITGAMMVLVGNACLRSGHQGLSQQGEFGASREREQRPHRRRRPRRAELVDEDEPVTSPRPRAE
jgi:ABC-type transport system involved in multi-copper enzyme maturation permease subunit